MNRFAYSVLASSMLLLAACGGGGSSETSQDNPAKKSANNAEAMESEVSGKIQFYTSQPDSDAAALVKEFNKVYPDVEVEVFRSGTEEVMSKIAAEHKAGDIQADVLLAADAVTFETLKEDDLLLSYESHESKNIPKEFVDEDHMYTGTKVMATVLAVNTNEVDQMPASWNVLTETDSKGKAIMPSPLYSGAAAYNVGVFSRQQHFGWEFFEDLHANEMTIVQGNGAVLQAVAGGEKAYGMVVDYLVARAKQEGSPVEIVYPEEGVPVITEPIGIMKNTDNGDAAKAFVDFVLSEKGQTLSAELGYTPIRDGVKAPEGLKSISDLTVISHDVKELLKTREEDKQKFSKILGE